MEIEQLNKEDLYILRAGKWICIEGEWFWIDMADYEPDDI